jgi:hypothetical protein
MFWEGMEWLRVEFLQRKKMVIVGRCIKHELEHIVLTFI